MKLKGKEAVEYVKTNLKEFGGVMSQTQIAKEIEKTAGRVSQIVKSLRQPPSSEASEFSGEAAAS